MSKVLTPFQAKFLDIFFRQEESNEFFLTGGTALAEYYLTHRYSDDLDLFTTSKEALISMDNRMPAVVRSLHLQIVNHRRIGDFSGYILQDLNTSEGLKIDLVRDIEVQFGTKRKIGTYTIDSIENISSNKICTILSRTEVKDFVDLYFLIKENYITLDKAIEMGKEKDLGLEEFIMAGLFRQADHFETLPRMIKPLALETLRNFYQNLSNQILDQIKPV